MIFLQFPYCFSRPPATLYLVLVAIMEMLGHLHSFTLWALHMDHEQEIDTSDAGASSSSSIDTPSSLEPAVNAEQPQESATQSTGQDQAAQAVEPPQAE